MNGQRMKSSRLSCGIARAVSRNGVLLSMQSGTPLERPCVDLLCAEPTGRCLGCRRGGSASGIVRHRVRGRERSEQRAEQKVAELVS
jgi:hypothetical protein